MRDRRALEDIIRGLPWIENMVTIAAGCALGNLMGMFVMGICEQLRRVYF